MSRSASQIKEGVSRGKLHYIDSMGKLEMLTTMVVLQGLQIGSKHIV